MKNNTFDFKYNDIELVFKKGDFITVLGNNNDLIASRISDNIISINDILNLSRSKIIEELENYIKKNKVIIINNILSLLDNSDYKLIVKMLKDYSKEKIIINLTNNENETLFGNKVAIIYNNKLVCFGGTLSVLNEEKTLKRLGIGLPFIIELNKYLMDYGLIDNYYLSNKKLVGVLWK